MASRDRGVVGIGAGGGFASSDFVPAVVRLAWSAYDRI
jgi:hypothetical protein